MQQQDAISDIETEVRHLSAAIARRVTDVTLREAALTSLRRTERLATDAVRMRLAAEQRAGKIAA